MHPDELRVRSSIRNVLIGWLGELGNSRPFQKANCLWRGVLALMIPRSQRGGRGFESPLVHQILKNLTDFSELNELAKLAN